MTSRTRPVRLSIIDARPAPLTALALMACLALSAACGSLSRPLLARHDSAQATTPGQRAELLGAEPTLAPLWLWTAQRQPAPEAALALVERGRSFHPRDPDLLLAQASLLGLLQRDEAVQSLVRAALQSDCPVALEARLRWTLILAELAGNDLAAAQAEALRLGGVRGVPSGQVADAWARIAASQEFLGQPGPADQSLENSLDLGPDGLIALREISAREPQRQAACDALLARARSRHPDHPDLALLPVVAALQARDPAAAEQALARLPEALPERLLPGVELLRTQVDVLAGRTEPALAVLRARLDEDPADEQALAVLIECWRLQQAPSKDELHQRLERAAGRIGHPALAAQVRELLRELSAEPPGSP